MTHYSSFDVMEYVDEWDSHTKEVVKKRMGPFPQNKFLTAKEVQCITKIADYLTYDSDEDILAWVVHHFDSILAGDIGESQRKYGTPLERDLVRDGIKALDESAIKAHGKDFMSLGPKEQQDLITDIQKGQAPKVPQWSKAPQQEFFKKLAEIIVSAYYSHPTVWSQVGYGGPAYPRGYIRVELGVTDPWEARR